MQDDKQLTPFYQINDAHIRINSLENEVRFLREENEKMHRILSNICNETSKVFWSAKEVLCSQ